MAQTSGPQVSEHWSSPPAPFAHASACPGPSPSSLPQFDPGVEQQLYLKLTQVRLELPWEDTGHCCAHSHRELAVEWAGLGASAGLQGFAPMPSVTVSVTNLPIVRLSIWIQLQVAAIPTRAW